MRLITLLHIFVGFESLNTQDKGERLTGSECPPLPGRDGHLSSTCCCRHLFRQRNVAHIVALPNYQEDEATFGEARSKSCPLSFGRNVLAMEVRESLNIQGKGECLMAATSHHSEDMMATRPPPGFTGEVAGKSSNTHEPSDSPGRNIAWCA